MVPSANLALKFLLELAAVAAFAYWGTTVGGSAVGILIAIAAATAAIVLWGRVAAPRSEHRLPLSSRVPFELIVFALAALALVDAGQIALAVTLATLVIANSALLTLFDQWDRWRGHHRCYALSPRRNAPCSPNKRSRIRAKPVCPWRP